MRLILIALFTLSFLNLTYTEDAAPVGEDPAPSEGDQPPPPSAGDDQQPQPAPPALPAVPENGEGEVVPPEGAEGPGSEARGPETNGKFVKAVVYHLKDIIDQNPLDPVPSIDQPSQPSEGDQQPSQPEPSNLEPSPPEDQQPQDEPLLTK